MDHQSLSNVLGILRLIKRENRDHSTIDAIRAWVGSDVDEIAVLKVAAYVTEQVRIARVVIANSQLPDEAKEGVQTTLDGIEKAFTLNSIHASAASTIGNVSAAISNFVILLSVTQIDESVPPPEEAEALVTEIEALLTAFNDGNLDPVVRDVAKRHLKILSTLLQHIPIFGVEAAMTTYFELMTRVRRADIGTTDSAKSKLQPLWDQMEKWGKRLASIDKIWNSGARLLNHAGKARDILTYLGPV